MTDDLVQAQGMNIRAGLLNNDNVCWINSVLQLLCACPPLVKALFQIFSRAQYRGMGDCGSALADIFTAMVFGQTIVDATPVIDLICAFPE